jgi:hypothetical protein
MNDRQVLSVIDHLVSEQRVLYRRSERDDLPDEEHRRLGDIDVHLERCWDLLRQRRALRSAGADPDAARMRDAETVRHYLQ